MRKLILFFMVPAAIPVDCLAQAFELESIFLASGDTLRGIMQGKPLLQDKHTLNIERL